MAVELKVPEVGESITEVEIGDWLLPEGARASREDTVVMIETDKVTVELPAPVSGVITRIVIPKGGRARVGDVIGYMEEAGPSVARPSAPPPAAAAE
ncbi:MAG: dihydrolipoamide succinyltransferase, partial [Deltaproteobacteria bacterium]|nr:dihydrolipoamide succinyltransferase [Deltaproteobacteria bacterium]